MNDPVIKIENLSKRYRLGLVGSGTLKDDLKGWWYRVRGREDPTLKIGEENRLETQSGNYIWALRNINLEVNRGEVLGIIGKNGAGKSTLLKLLSRVTGPTEGLIHIRGRIASLLEVGTGMHPELTGRENVFLNGAILGMSKPEIRSKFDEIVDFAGIARYVDTPVKRYSSGMHVRLGFAVAAFLEPEILIVDEVLAVGDAEFQKKAIGKMQDVSRGEGRTVLFVSHNMISIKSLCTKAILMEMGRIRCAGDAEEIVNTYQRDIFEMNSLIENNTRLNNGLVILHHAKIASDTGTIDNGTQIKLDFEFTILEDKDFAVILNVFRNGQMAFGAPSFTNNNPPSRAGRYRVSFIIPEYILNPGFHSFDFSVVDSTGNFFEYGYFDRVLYFEVEDDNTRRGNKYTKGWAGAVSPLIEYEIIRSD